MRGVSRRQPASSGSEGTPYRHLAVRVIDQALRDLASPAGSPADQKSARAFLAGSSMLYHWCEVADLDPAWMVARTRKLVASSGRFSAPAVIEAVGSAKGAAAASDGMWGGQGGTSAHCALGGNTKSHTGGHMAAMNGTIKRLVSEKGFGFVEGQGGHEYFFHQSACTATPFDDLREGQAVTFETGQGPKGPRAENVRPA